MKHNKPRAPNLIGSMFIIGVITFFSVIQGAQAAFPGFGNSTPASFADLAEEVKHSVVNISTTQVVKGMSPHPFSGPNSSLRRFFGDDFFKHFFGNVPRKGMKTHALGSGFVISNDGLILTNNHVIKKATEIKVKLQNGKEYDAKIIGSDPKTDLALIQAKPDADFPKPVRLGDSDVIRVGDWVMAVGNPFGLGQTVTTGIISAKGRVIGAGPYDDFLQTDAAINPGNSGGPLFNMKGQVVGINTAIIVQAQSIGFAIPVNIAKDLLPQLKSGKIIRGWLGVMIQDITPELAGSFGLEKKEGVLISDVTDGSPAEKGGLKRGDIITGFDEKKTENAHALSRLVAATQPNKKVVIDIIRDKKEKSIKLKIGTMPQKGERTLPQKASAWGLTVQNLTTELAQRLGINSGGHGVVISAVEPGSPAAESGLRTSDVIKEVNRHEIHDINDYNEALEKTNKSEGILLLIKRGRGTLYVILKSVSQG